MQWLDVSTSKIIPPSFPAILERPRLMARLQQNRDKKLILILGQAAQGKSILAVSWVKSSETATAWVNLDQEDSEAVNLFYLLGHSLQWALPDIDFSLILSLPSLTLAPRKEAPLFREWILALLQPISAPVQVIFDGLDRLDLDGPGLAFSANIAG